MLNQRVRNDPPARARRWTTALLASSSLLLTAPALRAQEPATPSVSVGAGMRTSVTDNFPDGDDSYRTYALDSLRLYVSGVAAPHVKFMVNTEYDGGNHIDVMDAAAQFEFTPKFNVWAGRFLPPSDRANKYGPYYAHHWAVFSDGVQDGYPGIFQGRDNGVMYWGQFDKIKVSGGLFDGLSATGRQNVLTAGRVQIDFWDPEAGYYLNGTYYGGKNLLAVGLAGQVQSGDDNLGSNTDTRTAASIDFLLERKAGNGGAYSIEAEWANYNRLGGYNARYGSDKGGYFLGSYLFPGKVGPGKFELLGKFAQANFSKGLTTLDKDYDQKTSEFNFNYLIKEFNARVMFFYKDTRFNAVQTNFQQVGLGIQLQM